MIIIKSTRKKVGLDSFPVSGILEGIDFLNFAWKHIFSQCLKKENLIQIQMKPNVILINRCRSMYICTYVRIYTMSITESLQVQIAISL